MEAVRCGKSRQGDISTRNGASTNSEFCVRPCRTFWVTRRRAYSLPRSHTASPAPSKASSSTSANTRRRVKNLIEYRVRGGAATS